MNRPRFRLSDPGDAFAAVPAMLGFYPTDSLVLILLATIPGHTDVQATVAARLDLDLPDDLLTEAAGQLVEFALTHHTAEVLALVVDSTAQPHRPSGPRLRTLDIAERALTDHYITVRRAWHTRTIAAGSPWWSLRDPSETGTIPDPANSEIARAHARAQRPIRSSRDALTAMVAVDQAVVDRVREILDATLCAPRHNPPDALAADTDDRVAVESILARIDQIATGAPPTPADLAAVAVALRNSTVRSCVCGLVSTARAQAAQQLWALLTRSLPDPDRADAAVLLAFSAYHAGEGVLADIAATTALHSDPEHTVAHLLLTSLRSGTPPQHLAPAVHRAHDIAATLDIDLHH